MTHIDSLTAWFCRAKRPLALFVAFISAALAGGLVRGPVYGVVVFLVCLIIYAALRLKQRVSPLIRD